MNAYHYVGVFFSGLFLTNAVPHFINGISGNPFPTPFASPPGKGLSSPLVNVLWALLNAGIGCALWKASALAGRDLSTLAIFFTAVALMSVVSSIAFANKAKA